MNPAILKDALKVLSGGGVIAYPTEHCFGLGCDPSQLDAVQRILTIKQRAADQGLILIGLDEQQLSGYANFEALTQEQRERLRASWPGASTWLVPAVEDVSPLIRGVHQTIAVRVPSFAPCRALLSDLARPLVSTSANRHGEPALLRASDVVKSLGDELDYVVDAPVGGASQPSTITDARSGLQLR